MHSLHWVLVAILACGCGERQAPTAPSSDEVMIRAQVMDFRTGAGLPAKAVQFRASHLSSSGEATTASTDESGFYILALPAREVFVISVDGVPVGTAQVTRFPYRGDILVGGGTCVSRYGVVASAQRLRPVVGATVSVGGGTAVTGPDGWYRIDLGCPSTGSIGFNTTFLRVTHPNYASSQTVVGRGVQGVRRLDVHLTRP